MTAREDALRRLADLHADALSRLPNVVGVGVTQDGGGAVAVYVATKVPAASLKPEQRVPPCLSGTLDGTPVEVPTRVIEVGTITR